MTFESWTPLMYHLGEAMGSGSSGSGFTYCYFDLAAMMGGFFFVNMVCACGGVGSLHRPT